MSRNVYQVFLDLLPVTPLQVGAIVAIDGDVARLTLPGGGTLTARGVGSRVLGDEVFVRDGVIEGDAPAGMPLVQLQI